MSIMLKNVKLEFEKIDFVWLREERPTELSICTCIHSALLSVDTNYQLYVSFGFIFDSLFRPHLQRIPVDWEEVWSLRPQAINECNDSTETVTDNNQEKNSLNMSVYFSILQYIFSILQHTSACAVTCSIQCL